MSNYHRMVFEGNSDEVPRAVGMRINVGGKLLAGVRDFKIEGKAGDLIQATVTVEADTLRLVAEGKIEGDVEAACDALERLADRERLLTADDLAGVIGESTGEYPEWNIGAKGVIEDALRRRISAKGFHE